QAARTLKGSQGSKSLKSGGCQGRHSITMSKRNLSLKLHYGSLEPNSQRWTDWNRTHHQ
ncbi:hypothetical protein L9F63_023477, partial [Diploptera punctata]